MELLFIFIPHILFFVVFHFCFLLEILRGGGVPGAGLEPARIIHPADFKSAVSTYSTIRA